MGQNKITYRKTFGPGSLESIEVVGYRRDLDDEFVRIVQGTYTVYCGMGNSHEVPIDSGEITSHDWENYRDSMDPESRVAFDDDGVVGQIVNDVLDEEWSDPCDVLEPEFDLEGQPEFNGAFG